MIKEGGHSNWETIRQEPAGRVILLLGGARSGKSDFAEGLANSLGRPVLYLATATPGDREMAGRIAAHQARRPANWTTVEAPTDVAVAAGPHLGEGDVLLLDCLTLLASNVLIAHEGQPGTGEAALASELDGVLDLGRRRCATLIIVSNEVGLGLAPTYSLGRAYRDVLGRANQRLAGVADVVLFFIAGLPVDLKKLSRESLADLGLAGLNADAGESNDAANR